MATLQEIALQAGVSSRTVTRVLRGDTKEVWPSAIKRAERIRQIAKKLGYRPNSSASAIRKGRFDCLGLLLSSDDGRSNLPATLLDGIHDELLILNMHLTIARLPDETLVEKGAFPRIVNECCCDGLLVNYTDRIPNTMLKRLEEDPVPSIWLNCKLKHDCIHYDDFEAGRHATEALLERGHRKIAYLDFTQFHQQPDSHYSRVDRYAGHVQVMEHAGLTPTPREQFAGNTGKERLATIMQLLGSTNRPTAIISYDAGERILLAAAMSGLQVPKDLSLITFDDELPQGNNEEQGEYYIGINLAKMRLPTGKAGKEAVSMLLQKIENPKKKINSCVLPIRLDEGETLGCV